MIEHEENPAITPTGMHFVYRHSYEHPELGVEPRIKRALSPAFKARKFCGACNSGWMNRIDRDVRPVLERLGPTLEPTTLTRDDQFKLALWATKTILAFETMEPPEYQFALPELYPRLFESRAPLSGTQLWLGANAHGLPCWHRCHSLDLHDPLVPAGARGFGATLSFGHLVLHMIGTDAAGVALRLRYEPHRALKQIWPIEEDEVSWPPPLLLQPFNLTPLAGEIARNCALVAA